VWHSLTKKAEPVQQPIEAEMEIHAVLDKNKNLNIKMMGDPLILAKILLYLEKTLEDTQMENMKGLTTKVKTQPLYKLKIIGESVKGVFARLRVVENQRE
jgi:hypothetical protein